MRASTPLPLVALAASLRWVVLAVAVVAAPISEAAAQPSKAKAPAVRSGKPASPKVDVGPAVQKLRSGDEAQIRAGLDDLRMAGSGAAAGALAVADLLSRGLAEPLTIQAIDTLGDLESESGSAALAQYATHRTLAVRRAAVKALTRTKGAGAAQALRRALGDADAQVRGNAAAGLGGLGAKDAVPDLILALDHRVNEAAASIGLLCDAQQCVELAAKLGKLPFDVITGGLELVLSRPSGELSDDVKIKVVERVRALGTAEAGRFLGDVQKHLPRDASSRLKQAVSDGLHATGGSQ